MFDAKHPPPPTITTLREAIAENELFWPTHVGIATIPFCINLPLNLGPPPYASRHASIRYVLVPTLVLKNGSKRGLISQPRDIQMLTVYDPYKALASLPSPLTATEALRLDDSPEPQSVRLTAGLHRQTWISGNSIFVDVHIVNKSERSLRKLELQLQRSTLWYAHAAAGTRDRIANHLRLPKRQETDTINSTIVRKPRDWNATPPSTSELRTCHIQVPQGHVTISTGRFFEVRYFLNVIVTVARFKTITVQLPISLIHMNSLDIVPNVLAQVAASIEAKRSKTLSHNQVQSLYQPYHQGQAFVAPQKQSLEQRRAENHDKPKPELDGSKRKLDESPSKTENCNHCSRLATFDSMKQKSIARTEENTPPHCRHRHGSDCYHCHILQMEHEKKNHTSISQAGPKLPRLQVSTSGLGFTESEISDFSAKDLPLKKVMLSEQERKMIRQQRELQHRKEWTVMQKQTSIVKPRRNSQRERNEAPVVPNAHILLEQQIRRAEPHVLESKLQRRRSKTTDMPLRTNQDTEVRWNTLGTRERANTGSDMHRPGAGDATILQDASNLGRLSSQKKKKGKLPVDSLAPRREQPTSTASLRPTSRQSRNRN